MAAANRANVLVLQTPSTMDNKTPAGGKQAGGDSGTHPSGVYLYAHYTGDQVPEKVRAALSSSKDRWSDSPVLTGIIFAKMIEGNDVGQFAIAHDQYETQNPILVLDCNRKVIFTVPTSEATQLAQGNIENIRQRQGMSFDEFSKLDLADPTKAWQTLEQRVTA